MSFDTRNGTRGSRQPSEPLNRWLNKWAVRRLRRKGGKMMGFNALVLTTVGRKSGLERTKVAGGAPPQVRADGLPHHTGGRTRASRRSRAGSQTSISWRSRDGPDRDGSWMLPNVRPATRLPAGGTCPPGGTPSRASGTTARTPCRRPARATGSP